MKKSYHSSAEPIPEANATRGSELVRSVAVDMVTVDPCPPVAHGQWTNHIQWTRRLAVPSTPILKLGAGWPGLRKRSTLRPARLAAVLAEPNLCRSNGWGASPLG